MHEGDPATAAAQTDIQGRLVRLEVLVTQCVNQLDKFADATARMAAEHRAGLDQMTGAMRTLQDQNNAARREDQEQQRRSIEGLQSAAAIARREDQASFQAAMADVLKKVEGISSTNNDMATKFIKREDLLWIRQAVGSLFILLGGGVWTWWLGLHK